MSNVKPIDSIPEMGKVLKYMLSDEGLVAFTSTGLWLRRENGFWHRAHAQPAPTAPETKPWILETVRRP